jgi:hypothetical protein
MRLIKTYRFAKNLNIMKRISTLFAFAFLSFCLVSAQAPLPNGSFETWTGGSPDAWGTSDGVLTGFGLPDPGTAERDTLPANVYQGTSSVRLTNKNVSTPFGAQDVPGVVSLGNIAFDISTFSVSLTGLPYTDRPDSVRFATKYNSGPGGTDTGGIVVNLTAWTPQGPLLIGEAFVPFIDHAAFQVVTAKINYHSFLTPDTLYIQGLATIADVPVMESTLWLDDVSFIGLDTAFKAYINPDFYVEACAGDTVLLRTDQIPNNSYQWYRNNTLISGAINPGFRALTPGNYYVQVTSGGIVYTSDTVKVLFHALPNVTYTVPASQDTLCSTANAFTLTGASPSGGFFTGNGVDSAGNFDPTFANLGLNPVTYSYTDNFGCTAEATQNIFVKLCTGIDVLEEGLQVNIYPNPARNNVVIETQQKMIGGSIEVYDVDGKLVIRELITNLKSNLSVAQLPSGLYQIRLVNTNNTMVANAKISVAR